MTTLLNPKTPRDVLEAMVAVSREAPADSTFLLFFSGHSYIDERSGSQWVLADSDLRDPLTMLPAEYVQRRLSVIPSLQKGVFQDTAYSRSTVVSYESAAPIQGRKN